MRRWAVMLVLVSSAAASQMRFEDLEQLDLRLARESNGAAVPLDRRLRLARCPVPVAIDAADEGMTVRCVPLGWRIRVAMSGAAGGTVLVHRGDQVELSIDGEGFVVDATAIAMEDGRAEGSIRVKTSTTAPAVTGRVTGPGRVSLTR